MVMTAATSAPKNYCCSIRGSNCKAVTTVETGTRHNKGTSPPICAQRVNVWQKRGPRSEPNTWRGVWSSRADPNVVRCLALRGSPIERPSGYQPRYLTILAPKCGKSSAAATKVTKAPGCRRFGNARGPKSTCSAGSHIAAKRSSVTRQAGATPRWSLA